MLGWIESERQIGTRDERRRVRVTQKESLRH